MIFKMTKPTASSSAVAIVICALLVCLCVFLAVMFFTSRSYKLEIKEGMLNIQSIFYNTHIKLNDVLVDSIRPVDYDTLGVSVRTNGMGMPGLQIGWFQGKGKKYKEYVTDKKNVLLIPTVKGYDILFSTTQGTEIADIIRREAGK